MKSIVDSARRRRAPLACTVLLLVCATHAAAQPASSAATCTRWNDERGVLALGRHAIGTPPAALAPLRKGRTCMRPDAQQPQVCEFFDRDGIAYVTDEDGVVRIEARRGTTATDARLPLGLRLGDSFDNVVAKVEALPSQAPREQLLAQAQRQARALATGECIVHGTAPPASFFVEFDRRRRLRRVGLMVSNV